MKLILRDAMGDQVSCATSVANLYAHTTYAYERDVNCHGPRYVLSLEFTPSGKPDVGSSSR